MKEPLTSDEQMYLDELSHKIEYGDSFERYSFLLTLLWRKEFYYIIYDDNNRAGDGIYLRTALGYREYRGDFGPPRCLEVLIGLAQRLNDSLGYSTVTTVRELFWELIRNLGLIYYENSSYNGFHVYFEMDDILTRWMERRYARNGEGGVFPLKNPPEDMRKASLWKQLGWYAMEREKREKLEKNSVLDSKNL